MIALSNPEKIALLTDSTADPPAPMREGKPIYVVPLKIRCEDGEYSDGVDITAEGVYERLHRGELPRRAIRSTTAACGGTWCGDEPSGFPFALDQPTF